MRAAAGRLLVIGALIMVLVSVPAQARIEDPDGVKEFQVKALFLYNFANFVEWPERAFDGPEASLRMCLYGAVPFGSFLDSVNGVRVRDRTLDVIRTTDRSDIEQGCHILFVGIDQLDKLEEFFSDINHMYVLSVGNTEGFARRGGVINIYRTRDERKFEINLSQAIENGLLISSDLLSLARIINKD
ncbi:hypothetical protein CK501_08345 [Halovibrio salipaludis]|uniref:YfiR family protein n=2 Tax=Halovibrio salipaludis TaxID=2032626 RepID=A0A2A2F7W1_9GAMM|nr:hypothetical protein CK501_08345 [Halovibrio salipaludis]